MKKRIFGAAAASVMLAGSALAFVAAPAGAAVTTVGTCTGQRGLATAKSTFIWPGDGKNAGVTDGNNHDATISTKALGELGNSIANPVGGTCNFTQAVAFDKGLTTTPADLKQIDKWTSKTVTPEIDCVSESTPDPTEWPASGKTSYTYDDGLKTDVYITFANPTGAPTDTITLEGIVIKGVAVGSNYHGGISYTPAIKNKLGTIDYQGYDSDDTGEAIAFALNVPYDYPPAGPTNDAVPTANDIALYPGYIIDNPLGLAGCQGTAAAAPGAETANLRTIYIQGGPSPLLNSAVTATSFTIGAA